MGKLNALSVKRLIEPGRYGDGAGLYLQVRDADRRSWLFRYMLAGKAREMGLGAFGDVSLAQARDAAADARKLLKAGTDPLQARSAAKQAARVADAPALTLSDVVDRYIAAHEAGWGNAKHRGQWRTTLDAYAGPVFGSRPVAAVDTGMVMLALEPVWRTKPETASRLRSRIEAVLDYAKTSGWRSGENPARWRGHLANLLPKRSRVQAIEHHPALPWRSVSAFLGQLRERTATAARCLELVILTAARSGEAVGAKWDEIDLAAGIWTIPKHRMKAGVEHRVPLSRAAIILLRQVRKDHPAGDYVFPGTKPGRPLSHMALPQMLIRMGRADITVHGFRSTFRDWAAETTNYPREVAEAALAHALRDKVEAAYRRSDLFEKRGRLMEDWAAFCAAPAPTGEVVPSL